MVTIADKINAMLAERGLLKRDLARALGVSPQTATDICKGRSAVTLRHLRNLVQLFEVSADYWIDDSRLAPDIGERLGSVAAGGTGPRPDPRVERLRRAGLLDVDDPETLLRRLGEFVRDHRHEFVRRYGMPGADVRRLLGLDVAVDGSDLGALDRGALDRGASAALPPRAGEDAAALN